MKIALDYDGTYTQDPEIWDLFLYNFWQRGHDVRVVTHRHAELDKIEDLPLGTQIIYTDGVAKKWYCEHREPFWVPDIWIDDKPKGILENGPLDMETIQKWRDNGYK
ncbi:hypothetical protein EVB99_088 [Rhizobium phage RHph_N3_19]|nr:hypothetical protein EVB99_088 [Rhizobium phage RHph_N3_19]